MPPPLLFDLESVDFDAVIYDRERIYERLPQRDEFELLDAVCLLERERGLAVAYHDCRDDGWWARGHIPGRPIFPGVLQLEAAAQLTVFMCRYVDGFESFVAFSGVDDCRFREAVTPPARFVLLAKVIEDRPRRIKADVQGVVGTRIVFEATVSGMLLPAEVDSS